MLIAGVVCLCAALAAGASGVWTLTRPKSADLTQQVLRAVAPVQLAAAVMLAAGGVVAVAVPAPTGLVVLIVCVVGAVGTILAGSWQGARFATRPQPAADCGSSCGSCTLSCSSALVPADVDGVRGQ
ncbi:hypothetical protein MMUR_05920 [Mycolicibacterium murale]|uniref:Transmembrane protein n=1 Tax=Mycolicibacterium murale TaxID=182220 RepID=A0A7I9WGP9_9MYCO|nr:hypothetical protein [Mycolicibacterium murale]MCV7182905.1 hypothetical protein [Mycolicibacterium murale]GFG56456.1 hypothetical protein MMUR_05920 [Mycolicibacterium murale]